MYKIYLGFPLNLLPALVFPFLAFAGFFSSTCNEKISHEQKYILKFSYHMTTDHKIHKKKNLC